MRNLREEESNQRMRFVNHETAQEVRRERDAQARDLRLEL
jgi:hypothetical protein